MKKILTMFLPFVLFGCIGTDIESEVDTVLRISASTKNMRVTETNVFESEYMNRLAQIEAVDVSWESSAPAVVSIDQSGNATALAIGEATISVLYDGLEDDIIVEVSPSKEAVSISNFVSILPVGDSFQFEAVYLDINGQTATPGSISWSSSNAAVLSIDQQGNVTAISEGTASITVETGNVTGVVEVQSTGSTIMVEEEVRITMFTNSIDIGGAFTFEASFFNTSGLPDSSAPVTWSSSDPSIISITSEGAATAQGVGSTNITASSGTKEMTIEVEVLASNTEERTVTLDDHGSGYNISGAGSLKLVDGKVILDLQNVKVEGPGPFFYLSNNAKSINGGLSLGAAKNGANSIDVTALKSNVQLNSYDYVVVWCDPFGVFFGYGELSN